MASERRRARIVELARANGIVQVADLVEDFQVSAMTIRRDLGVLAQQGRIRRIHGGGVPVLPGTASTKPASAPDRSRTTEAAGAGGAGITAPTDAQDFHVGIMVPEVSYYYPPVVSGVQRVLDTRSIRRTLVMSSYDPSQDEVLTRELLDAGSTGLLLSPNIALDDNDPVRLGWLFELAVPAVLVERTAASPEHGDTLCSVRTDHDAGCLRAVRYLRGLGHAGVALMTHGRAQTGARIIAGWRRAVESSGADPDRSPLHITDLNQMWPKQADADQLLDELRRANVTAVIIHNDRAALAFALRARAWGLRIPEDLSVIAYDDELAAMVDPPMTAVSPRKEWLGQAAVELLLELMTGSADEPARQIVVAPRLEIRGSTAPPSGSGLSASPTGGGGAG